MSCKMSSSYLHFGKKNILFICVIIQYVPSLSSSTTQETTLYRRSCSGSVLPYTVYLLTAPLYRSYHHILLDTLLGKMVKLQVDRATVGLFMFLRCLASGALHDRINITLYSRVNVSLIRLVSTCIVHVESTGTHYF